MQSTSRIDQRLAALTAAGTSARRDRASRGIARGLETTRVAGLRAPAALAVPDASREPRGAPGRRATSAATTSGDDPGRLHPTGQLHEGGPPSGRFLVPVHDPKEDLDVPAMPYSSGPMRRAQATVEAGGRARPAGNPIDRLRRA